MKYLAITEPPSEQFIRIALQKMGWGKEDFQKFAHLGHPQEDYLKVSVKYPIFAVADGVTLIQYILEKKEYPSPSPAGEIAKIFCEEMVREAEKRYDNFSEQDIKEVFQIANEAVRQYNLGKGLARETLDYWFRDFYAATGAFAVIKDGQVYWASICDSYVLHIDENGSVKFKSPDCDSFTEAKPEEYKGSAKDPKSKAQYTWRVRRNGINEEGKRVGYGVITGEPNAISYLSTGKFLLKEGEKILLFADGFEEYTKLPEFISLFTEWPQDLESRLKNFTEARAEEDPDKFGRERTLIAVRI